MIVRIEPTGYDDDARRVADFMREGDVREVAALCGQTPREAVKQAFEVSDEAYTAYLDGEPVGVFGATVTAVGRYGVPWFLGTPRVDEAGALMVKWGRRFVEHLMTRCDELENVAMEANRPSVVFLRRLGFQISQPLRNAAGVNVVRFRMEKFDV